MSHKHKDWYIADPVHQMLDFGGHEPSVKAIIARPEFQRLRHISQLGLASFVFPGAVHTRFSHSLGAAHLAARVGDLLSEEVSDQHSRLLVTAALLHDVGHGPFSHSFERALKKILPNKEQCPSHEHWTESIVVRSLEATLKEQGIAPRDICELIGKGDHHNALPEFLHQIISSQLDVDRIDYLCRDAHFAGVAVGTIDTEYLVRSLRIIEHASHKTLGIAAKGVPAFEAFAFARHVMNRTVYYHKTVAAFEAMMEECIQLLVTDDTVRYVPPFLRKLREVGTELTREQLTDGFLEAYLSITEAQVWTSIAEAARVQGRLGVLARNLLERNPVPTRSVAPGKHKILEDVLQEAGFAPSQFSVRSPRSRLYEQERGEQVFVFRQKSGTAVHISEASSLVDSLRDRAETQSVLVVFDRDAATDIVAHARKADCLHDERSRLSSPPSQRSPSGNGARQTAAKGPSIAKVQSSPPENLETRNSDASSS